MDRFCELKNNINEIKKKIGKSCLIAVSKYTDSSDVVLALRAGHHNFGESRVQDLLTKVKEVNEIVKDDQELALLERLKWHFIGHLQTNKVKMLLKVPGLKFIHSIDSQKLLDVLLKNEFLIDDNDELFYFLQVNVSGEDQKGGLRTYQELKDAVIKINDFKSKKLKFIGLMTIGSIRTDNFEEEARNGFLLLRSMRDQLQADFSEVPEINNLKLSMGMSSDYVMAVEEGSDFVRIGSAIFG